MEQLLELLKAVQLQEGSSPVDLSLHPVIGEALKKAIAHGAQTEKTKLYNERNGLKGQVSTLNNELTALRAQQQQALQTAPAQSGNPSSASNAPQQPGNTTTDQLLAQVLAKLNTQQDQPTNGGITKEDLAGMLSTTVNQVLPGLLSPLQEKLAALEKGNLEEYRQRRLAELGDAVIPELVKGGTREEIESSIEVAKGIASKYAPKAAEQNPPAGTPPVATPPVVTPPASVTNPPANMPAIPDVSKMSDKEYAAQRDELLRKLSTQV